MEKRIVESGLRKKGFQQQSRDHQYFVYHTTDGKKTPVKTKTSHGSQKTKTLGPELISQMARQCHLSKSKFEDLITCPLNQSEYEIHLREQDWI